MYKKKNSKVPFPEIASGEGPWKIYDDANQPRTSTLSHEMYVPTDYVHYVVQIITNKLEDMNLAMLSGVLKL